MLNIPIITRNILIITHNIRVITLKKSGYYAKLRAITRKIMFFSNEIWAQ